MLVHLHGLREGAFWLWQVAENEPPGWGLLAAWCPLERGQGTGPARVEQLAKAWQDHLRKWKGRSSERRFLFLIPYY